MHFIMRINIDAYREVCAKMWGWNGYPKLYREKIEAFCLQEQTYFFVCAAFIQSLGSLSVLSIYRLCYLTLTKSVSNNWFLCFLSIATNQGRYVHNQFQFLPYLFCDSLVNNLNFDFLIKCKWKIFDSSFFNNFLDNSNQVSFQFSADESDRQISF